MKKAAMSSTLIAVILFAVAVIAHAQQPKKVPRIGFLNTGSLSSSSLRVEAFRQGLREPTKFELIINLKAAKQIGLTIPPNVLGESGQSHQVMPENQVAMSGLN